MQAETTVNSLHGQLRDVSIWEHELHLEVVEARNLECGHSSLSKEHELADRAGVGHYCKEMEQVKLQQDERTDPQLCLLIKTEFQYEGRADAMPEIITK